MPAPSELSIAKVAGILSQSTGATMKEIREGLGVSRQTTIRWLTLMEKSGFLWKTFQSNGKKGRPLGVYHPTESLSELMRQHHRRSGVMLDFPVLSAMCRFNSRGICDLTGLGPERCQIEACPVLKTPLF
jgi:DNA-binding MarR family transcriptional regulator